MRSARRIAPALIAVGLGLATLLAAGCSSTAQSNLTVSGAWARAVAVTGQPSAAYMVISNGSGQPDALLSVSSPGASMVEVHETTTDGTGMTAMHPVDRVAIPGEGEVTLQPGGTHLMLMGLTKPLEVGSTIELDLMFQHAGRMVVMAEVRDG